MAAVVAVSLAFGGMVDAGSGSRMLESPASMSVVAENVAMQTVLTVPTRQLSGDLRSMVPTAADGVRGTSSRGMSVGSSPVLPIVSPLVPSRADLGTAALGTTTGARLLSELTRLGMAGISEFLSAYPSKIDALLASPPAAATVSGWWRGLGNSDQTAWLSAAPRVVGNLEGIPVSERSVANLRYLSETDADIRQRLASGHSRGEQTGLTQELSILRQVKLAVAEGAGHAARYLMQLDPADGGRAVVVIGNPDTADFVTYLVPGMNYGVQEQLVNWSATAEALYAEQKRVLRERSDPTLPAKQVATIAWIGYETPDLFSVGGLDRAENGADQLERAINGLREVRGDDQPFLSIIGHSYGSVLSLVALARGTLSVDTFTMVGSPGSASQSASDLNVNGGEVFVGEADWDPAVNSGFFGSDPGASSYGAHRLGVSGNRDALSGKWLKASFGHNEYFTPGSESLHNMALIGTGYAKQVTGRSE
ncbi:alpha/beta hydrolase [Leifsonia kafniensis]|uniref:alpha/beta hydrolase n=1 Tax=Leifsonia kafniensis TaxID=475957 RepID=UPI0031F103BE